MDKISIKTFFGKNFRDAREAKKFSRAALAVRLGISPKTIQSWEMGRTFIEDLSLIPAIEKELSIEFPSLISESAGTTGLAAAEEKPSYGSTSAIAPYAEDKVLAGPQKPLFVVYADNTAVISENNYMAVPLIKPDAANRPIAELTKKDIIKYCLFPFEWCTRGRVFVAYPMNDSTLEPGISQGSHVLVDTRTYEPRRLDDKYAALWLHDKGLRIRKVKVENDNIYGTPEEGKKRGNILLNPKKGDRILGKVIGSIANLS